MINATLLPPLALNRGLNLMIPATAAMNMIAAAPHTVITIPARYRIVPSCNYMHNRVDIELSQPKIPRPSPGSKIWPRNWPIVDYHSLTGTTRLLESISDSQIMFVHGQYVCFGYDHSPFIILCLRGRFAPGSKAIKAQSWCKWERTRASNQDLRVSVMNQVVFSS